MRVPVDCLLSETPINYFIASVQGSSRAISDSSLFEKATRSIEGRKAVNEIAWIMLSLFNRQPFDHSVQESDNRS